MIDFDKIFDVSDDGKPSPEDARKEQLARDDRELFLNKRLHEVSVGTSLERSARRDFGSQVYRATRSGPGGSEENIGLIFSGQRLEDLRNSRLMSQMENERQENLSRGDTSNPVQKVDLTGAWKMRSWKDREGKQHKAFDLVVASWSYESETGERITEGAKPSVPTATSESAREAAVQQKAAERTRAKVHRNNNDRGEIDF